MVHCYFVCFLLFHSILFGSNGSNRSNGSDEQIQVIEADEFFYDGKRAVIGSSQSNLSSPESDYSNPSQIPHNPSQIQLNPPQIHPNSSKKVVFHDKSRGLTITAQEVNINETKDVVATGGVTILYGQVLQASSENLYYKPEGVLVLQDNVKANFTQFGVLETEKELIIRGVQEIETIESMGSTLLAFDNGMHFSDAQILCPNGLLIDHIKRRIELLGFQADLNLNSKESLRNPNLQATPQNLNLEDKAQILFQDSARKMYADYVFIDYEVIDNKIAPKKIDLQGAVKIIHREGGVMQYALADRAVLTSPESELHLTSKKPKRVLFYDRANNLQMSAPEMIIQSDPMSGKVVVRGIGDVRFRFVEKEFEQIRKRFQLEKNRL